MKIKNYILGLISLISVSVMTACAPGCALIKDGETISWSKVDTVCSVIQIAAQTSTYAVCIKNQDLAPVFKAIGEGLIVLSGSASADQMSPEQIEAYIDSLMAENKWGTLSTQINGILSTLIAEYSKFYSTNKDKFKDEVNVCAYVIKAIGQGLVTGSDITATKTGASVNAMSPEAARDAALKAMNSLDVNVSK